MKKFIFLAILLLLIIYLFLYFGKKNNHDSIIGFAANKSDLSSDTLMKTIPSPDVNIANYRILFEGTQLIEYLLPKLPKDDRMVTHTGFTLAYNEGNEEADWVAYKLKGKEVHIQRKRTDNFRSDPGVQSGSATPFDYLHSGYDRGHLAPAADMKWSTQAMSESFFMSNMTPQVPDFNRGIWEDLEEQVRNWAIIEQEIYVVTGPVFEAPSQDRKYIGADRVAVPDAFYKIVLDYKQPNFKVISFLIPNEGSMQSYWQYTTSIDNIEKITGLDFFPSFPDTIETVLEQKDYASLWP
jgi:endonuclease G, mitochondrial